MFDSLGTTLFFLAIIHSALCLIPAKFQWKTMDWNWEGNTREKALVDGSFVPEHNMPFGLARWRNKLFITIPRWKKGVAASLNYVTLDGPQQQPLKPYPSWHDAFIGANVFLPPTNNTVVSAFRVCVDRRDRLWVVDNGVMDMASEPKTVSPPAILVFDLISDKLIHKYVIDAQLLEQSSVLTSIVVDDVGEPEDAFAYVTDMGSNAVLVYSLRGSTAWRLEHPHFRFDHGAAVYNVGGVQFYSSDGVSSATLSAPDQHGFCDIYLHPTSSTKQFKISSRVLKNKNATQLELMAAVEVVGDRGPNSQVTACDMDPSSNILFFTQLSKNGVGCWNADKPFVDKNTPLIASDYNLLEFPSDIKVDDEKNLWILSNRQSRFLYDTMDFNQVNFRVMTAPVDAMIEGSTCIPAPLEKEPSDVSLECFTYNSKKSTTPPKVRKDGFLSKPQWRFTPVFTNVNMTSHSAHERTKGRSKRTNHKAVLSPVRLHTPVFATVAMRSHSAHERIKGRSKRTNHKAVLSPVRLHTPTFATVTTRSHSAHERTGWFKSSHKQKVSQIGPTTKLY